ncbi:MAG: hypothetical protein K1Y36_10535 [Blastocatellia bacterium]|nr:hypothetical protein [Blastocatellia bacterium]
MTKASVLEGKKQLFAIRSEGQAQRCEICHQADEFDELSQTCHRCSGLELTAFEPPPVALPLVFRSLQEPPDDPLFEVQKGGFLWGVFFGATFLTVLTLLDHAQRGSWRTIEAIPLALFWGSFIGAWTGLLGGFLVGLAAKNWNWPRPICLWAGRVTGFAFSPVWFLLLWLLSSND